jgi:uncharacterized LabA/DUF88 family protein
MNERVAILVDVQNLFYSAKALLQSKVDYGKLLEGLSNGRNTVRAIAYLVQRPDVTQTNFVEALGRFGYDLRIKEVRSRTDEGGKVIPDKGNYDVLMTLDAVEIASKVDVITIVSGNGNLAPLARYLKMRGCRVEVSAFEDAISSELIKSADCFIPISDEWTFIDTKAKAEPQPNQESEAPVHSEFDERQPDSNEYAPLAKRR